tara:strand:+ start:1992 stop:2795 length:804 start_codon:yes stop_codon:yes gene_type:complete
MPQFEYSNLPFGAVGLTNIAAPRHYCGTTAPTAGTYNVGDVCDNPSPTASGSETALLTTGWICTTAGSPGTWTPMYSAAADQALTYTATTGTLTQGYRDIILNAATGPTLSLPAASARLAASQLTIKNIAANSATLSPLGTNAIIDASAITLTQNETVNLFTNGSTNWYVANTPVQPVVTNTFTSANTLTGYPSLTLLNAAAGSSVNLPVPTLAGTGTRMTIKQIANFSATLTPITAGNYADAAAITLTQWQQLTIQASGTFWYKVA